MGGKVECVQIWKESYDAVFECKTRERYNRAHKKTRVDDACIVPGQAKKKKHRCCFGCDYMTPQNKHGQGCPNVCQTADCIKRAGMQPALNIDGKLY